MLDAVDSVHKLGFRWGRGKFRMGWAALLLVVTVTSVVGVAITIIGIVAVSRQLLLHHTLNIILDDPFL